MLLPSKEATIQNYVTAKQGPLNTMHHLRLITIFLLLSTSLDALSQDTLEEDAAINAGVIYSSRYYWRGQWFYGSSAGVFLPYATYSKKNWSYYVGGEVGESLLFDSSESNESQFGDFEKDWTGLDFGTTYSTRLFDKLGLSLGAWYFWYFRSPHVGNDGIDNSFIDLRAAFSLPEVFLTPTLTYSHYLRVDDDYAKRTKEDFYITLGISHEKPFIEGVKLITAADINYWHYASKEESDLYGGSGNIPAGISDAKIKAGLSIIKGEITISHSFNYAYVFNEDFDYTSGSRFDRNKFWTTVGIDYAF
jgi:hypothetical protein